MKPPTAHDPAEFEQQLAADMMWAKLFCAALLAIGLAGGIGGFLLVRMIWR